MRLPRLYPIVDTGTLQARGEDVAEFARELLDGGAEIMQLRDKGGAPQQTLRYAEQISQVIEGTDILAVMNDRTDLALLAGWSAVHLGHTDMPPEAAQAVFGDRALAVGVSTHSEDQVRVADQGPASYIAIGPVFGTTSKADAEPVVGLEGVRRARALTRKPLVAIGGITLENAAKVIDAGADSVAVIGAMVTGSGSAAEAVQAFLRRLR